MKIENVIDQVSDGKPAPRDFDDIDMVVVHRCGKDLKNDIDLGDTAKEVCEHFTGKNKKYPEVAKATGGQLAYSIMISGDLGNTLYDGMIWQCLPVDDVGYHARRFSRKAIGIGLIADPRYSPPSDMQYNSLIDLLALLSLGFGNDPYKTIRGHDELIGGSSDEDKECPGDKLPMNQVRADVDDIIKDSARRRLSNAGLIFARGE